VSIRSQQKEAHMAGVFAVFLVAVLLAFARADGRARNIERLRALATGAVGIGRALFAKGAEIVELAAARLAQEHRSRAGLDRLKAMFETQGAGTNGLCTLTGVPEVTGNDPNGDKQRAESRQ
jgi:hypothetical protein